MPDINIQGVKGVMGAVGTSGTLGYLNHLGWTDDLNHKMPAWANLLKTALTKMLLDEYSRIKEELGEHYCHYKMGIYYNSPEIQEINKSLMELFNWWQLENSANPSRGVFYSVWLTGWFSIQKDQA